jgi:polyisoprenyl-phosphate glycosyltransferase
VIGCLFGAINALGISILGEYIVRIYDQVRQRPHYIVSRTVNVDAKADGRAGAPAGRIQG